jgi:hypothetical protein
MHPTAETGRRFEEKLAIKATCQTSKKVFISFVVYKHILDATWKGSLEGTDCRV